MWIGVPPSMMCDQHVLGEHKELHQEVGHMKAGNWNTVKGHVRRHQFVPDKVGYRHRMLVETMDRRGMNHDSPIDGWRTSVDTEMVASLMQIVKQVRSQCDMANVIECNRRDLDDRCIECDVNVEVDGTQHHQALGIPR